MTILIVDDNLRAVDELAEKVHAENRDHTIKKFVDSREALAFSKDAPVDLVFLNTALKNIDGLELAQRIRQKSPFAYIVFVTESTQCLLDAFRLHANAYIIMPASDEEIQKEVELAMRHRSHYQMNKVKIQCFGGFEVYSQQGRHITFKRNKAKELLAYLVDKRGASVNNAEIAFALWPDREYSRSLQSMVRTIISELLASLERQGVGRMVVREHNTLYINLQEVECDYYNSLNGNVDMTNVFMEDYMTPYSWAEDTNAFLTQIKRSRQ